MDDKKKQLNQIIILSALLAVLGFAAWNMVKSISGSGKSSGTRTAATAEPGTTAPTTSGTRVTPMGKIVSDETLDISKFAQQEGLIGSLNPNIFKIHGINSARNPFTRDPKWFSEELEKIPGQDIPEGFLDEMSNEVPDLNKLFNTDEEFVSYNMEKSMVEDDYSFAGKSADGKITTSIQARTKTEPTIRVDYTEREGRAEEEVFQPGASQDGSGLPNLGNPFGSTPWQEGSAPGAVRAPRNGDKDSGQFLSCIGISIKGDSKSALLLMPDGPRLVREDDVLMPGNLKVVKISELGVEIRDVRTAEQVLIPLAQSV
jgi:hypothetical protein